MLLFPRCILAKNAKKHIVETQAFLKMPLLPRCNFSKTRKLHRGNKSIFKKRFCCHDVIFSKNAKSYSACGACFNFSRACGAYFSISGACGAWDFSGAGSIVGQYIGGQESEFLPPPRKQEPSLDDGHADRMRGCDVLRRVPLTKQRSKY